MKVCGHRLDKWDLERQFAGCWVYDAARGVWVIRIDPLTATIGMLTNPGVCWWTWGVGQIQMTSCDWVLPVDTACAVKRAMSAGHTRGTPAKGFAQP